MYNRRIEVQLTDKETTMLSYCINKAQQTYSCGRVRVYSVATDKRGNILAEGGNKYNVSHTMQAMWAKKAGCEEKIFLHSEMYVLAKLLKHGKPISKPVTLYIARVDREGNIKPACPCVICAMALKAAGIKNIVTT